MCRGLLYCGLNRTDCTFSLPSNITDINVLKSEIFTKHGFHVHCLQPFFKGLSYQTIKCIGLNKVVHMLWGFRGIAYSDY